jgi:quinoprotein glucose dehydrogenase
MVRLALILVAFAIATAIAGAARDTRASGAWPAYGGGPEQIRYSGLTQIDRTNVRQLQVAWSYDSGETGGLQANPIGRRRLAVHDAVSTRSCRSTASGACAGRSTRGSRGRGPNRGVTYWASGGEARIFTGQGPFVYALDAATGKPIAGFGRDGRIDLRDGLGRDPSTQSVLLTTPGVVYKDLLIVGGRVSEGLPASPGDVRAYDTRTGALRWSFHTIPHPGEPGHETWPDDAWTYTGGVNNWAGMAVDETRGIVYVPTGSASADFYGANRLGDDLFANSLVALDAATGRRLWHFQAVHHDIWDRDFPSPPSLVTVTQNGRRIDAVAQTTKHGFVFLFDRTSGAPLFPIESSRVPKAASTANARRRPSRCRPGRRRLRGSG